MRLVPYGLNLFGINFDTIPTQNMSQIFHLWHLRRIFGFLDKQTMFLNELKNCIYMLKMAFPYFTINKDIINKDKDKRAKIGASNFIHETLESRGSIAESKGHDQKLIMSIMCVESGFRNASLFHMDLVVARSKIQFSEEIGIK
jgi:hypothetical protein